MDPDEWTDAFGPFDDADTPIGVDDLDTTNALQNGRPAHDRFFIHTAKDVEHRIEAARSRSWPPRRAPPAR